MKLASLEWEYPVVYVKNTNNHYTIFWIYPIMNSFVVFYPVFGYMKVTCFYIYNYFTMYNLYDVIHIPIYNYMKHIFH